MLFEHMRYIVGTRQPKQRQQILWRVPTDHSKISYVMACSHRLIKGLVRR